MLCDQAASKITLLMEFYSRSYGLRFYPRQMVQVVFAAGSLLLLKWHRESVVLQCTDARDGVLKCITDLRTIGQTWRYADMRASQLEARLQEQDQRLAPQAYPEPTAGVPTNSQAGQMLDAVMWGIDAPAPV
ncbi:hypothetical protein FS749_001822 [Ceratobasidium sp. UAMH 11750]|nr:hypothetical protein FS749_001822 [Ceratobasidium sp. UAMH 11750]